MAKRKVIETVDTDRRVSGYDNTAKIALGLSVIALLISLFALFGGQNETSVSGISGKNAESGLNQRVADLEARAALTKAQAQLLILTQRIDRDPTLNVDEELSGIRNDLEQFSNDPDRKIKEAWSDLITDLNNISERAKNGESITDRLNLLILRIQQEINNNDKN